MGVRNTSRKAYHNIYDLSGKQRLVYEVIAGHRGICNYDIAQRLGKAINEVTPRTNELVELGFVEEDCRKVCEATGRSAIHWRVKKEIPTLF